VKQKTHRHIFLGEEVFLLVEEDLSLLGISQEHLKEKTT
jgi:hypothetical protein